MARGKGKFRRKSSLKKSKPQLKNKKTQGKKPRSSNGRDIKHRDQFKRPSYDDIHSKELKRRKLQDDSESDASEAEEDSYKQLLSTFSNSDNKLKASVESEEELDDSSDERDHGNVNLTSGAESDSDNSEIQSEGGDEGNDDESPLAGKEDGGSEEVDDEGDTSDSECEQTQETVVNGDPYVTHICCDLSEEAVSIISKSKPPSIQAEMCWKNLGRILVSIPQIPEKTAPEAKSSSILSLEEPKQYAQRGKLPDSVSEVDWDLQHVKTQIREFVVKANSHVNKENESQILTPFQLELFTLLNTYQDLYFPERTLSNGEEVRFTYCLHAANHVLKTRHKVLHHSAKINKKNSSEVPEEFRDQGLVRPKVLILVPFREQARRVVELLIKLLVPEENKGAVMNKNRFEEEFSGQELVMPKKNPRPEDYEALFSGNTDDTFRLGLGLTKKCLKLYTDFYSSDIIISSPLGLRMIIGAEGESERDYDFLASIEILILDQADVFLMQNWDHLLHMMDHLHLQPRESHGTDFSRVRSWAVNGWAKYYRQTILFSSVALPECSALFNKRCINYAGCIRIANPISSGSICHVIVQLPQVFQQIEATSVSQALDSRFTYFTKKVLPEHLDPLMSHTLVFVPSYFDYVRIRNYLRKEGHSFVQICEYSKDGKVARARDMFYHSQVQFLLYSERFHFFRRPVIKGIRHIIFYQPPTMPHFYSEMCNHMQESNQNPRGGSESNMTVTILYSRFDAQQLAAIVGSERASRMLNSDRNVHMFVTGE